MKEVQVIAEYDSKSEAIKGIANHFQTTTKYLTLADGPKDRWWVYEGSILRSNYLLIKKDGSYQLVNCNGDFRYSHNEHLYNNPFFKT